MVRAPAVLCREGLGAPGRLPAPREAAGVQAQE